MFYFIYFMYIYFFILFHFLILFPYFEVYLDTTLFIGILRYLFIS